MSWLDTDEIEKLRSVYNREHSKEQPISKGNPEKVWSEIQHRLASKCKTGRAECIVASMLSRPRAPKEWALNRNEWLSSDDIDDLEKNYTKVFSDYFYVGSVPIDFDIQTETRQCLVSALCSMKLPNLAKKGKHRIGIVLNTDPHDGPGQHWVAVFVDVRPELEYPRMTYFDSYAHKPEKEIVDLMHKWKAQWDETGIHMKEMELTYNSTRHQYKDSECGMYCLYFHYACLLGIPMDERIPDDVVNSFRNLLFRIPAV